jgi:hypothetical protein
VGELCLAAANDNIIALKKLLTCGISINASDYDKRNPLMVAGSKGIIIIIINIIIIIIIII